MSEKVAPDIVLRLDRSFIDDVAEVEVGSEILAATVMRVATEDGANNYVSAFRADSSFRASERDAALRGGIGEPRMNLLTNLPVLHEERRRAYVDLATLASIVEGWLADNPDDTEHHMLLATVKTQMGCLAFIHGAEALSFDGTMHKQPLGDRLAGYMERWASQEVWRPADSTLAQPLIRHHLQYVDRAYNQLAGLDPRYASYLDRFATMAISIGEQSTPAEPSEEELTALRDLVMDRFGETFDHMFDGEPEDRQYTEHEAAVLFQKALDQRGLSVKGWRVVVDLEGYNNMSVEAAEKTVYIGKRASLFGREDIMRLMVHEIGVHAERYQNAEDQNLSTLVRFGLPGYLAAEEGLSNLLEFAVRGRVANKLHRYRYVSGAIAAGAVDGEKRTFGQTFPYAAGYALAELARANEPMTEKRVATEVKRAYLESVRSFRGMPPVAGLTDLSALSYYDGATRIWRDLFSRQKGALYMQPDKFSELFVGKYDPTDQQHHDFMLAEATRRRI